MGPLYAKAELTSDYSLTLYAIFDSEVQLSTLVMTNAKECFIVSP
jgi:hypothetical protein